MRQQATALRDFGPAYDIATEAIGASVYVRYSWDRQNVRGAPSDHPRLLYAPLNQWTTGPRHSGGQVTSQVTDDAMV
jgi:hypothetical protein